MYDRCFICKGSVLPFQWRVGTVVTCPTCGEYEPLESFLIRIHDTPLKESHLLSGAIRANYENGKIVKIDRPEDLLDSTIIPRSPLEKVDRILLYVANKSDKQGGVNSFSSNDYSIGFARDIIEFHYLIELARELEYFKALSSLLNCKITATGWNRVNEISKIGANSNQAFVAMSFTPALDEVWENGIKPALIQTGYSVVRMDNVEHNGKIDDQIIAEIRKSGLLVADFTEQRAGVYFEAGLATGIGIPVIWSCKEIDIANVHFDTRQYNYVTWQDSSELKQKLINRIEATLPNRLKRK